MSSLSREVSQHFNQVPAAGGPHGAQSGRVACASHSGRVRWATVHFAAPVSPVTPATRHVAGCSVPLSESPERVLNIRTHWSSD